MAAPTAAPDFGGKVFFQDLRIQEIDGQQIMHIIIYKIYIYMSVNI